MIKCGKIRISVFITRRDGFGISARAGTPPEVITRLHADIARALKTAEIKAAFDNAGAEPGDMTPEQFAALFSGRNHEVGEGGEGSRNQRRLGTPCD